MIRVTRLSKMHVGVFVGLGAAMIVACSWQRFDEITDDTPILLLEVPRGIKSAGTAVSAIRRSNGTTALMASGVNGYALYEFGSSEPSRTNAIARGTCTVADGCFIAQSTAPIIRSNEGQNRACIAFAMSLDSDGLLRATLHCEDSLQLSVSIPEQSRSQLGTPNVESLAEIRFASGPRREPTRLLVGVPNRAALWYYPSPTDAAVAIASPTAQLTKSYLSALAVMDSSMDAETTGTTLVIGEPEARRVHLISIDGTGTPTGTSCVEAKESAPNFGAMLSPGYFASSTVQSLAIGGSNAVYVVPSLEVISAATSATTGCVPLGDVAGVRSLAGRDFGLPVPAETALSRGAMTAADLNADGIDELIVGAPTAAASGERAAGQILTIGWTEQGLAVREHWAPSAAESGDRLGESVVAIPLTRPDVVLAGAPGGNKLAAFYCSTLAPAGVSNKRCN